jgi:hypothetical protein
MSILILSQDFGGDGSARIRVRVKFFKKPVTIPRQFWPTPIGWPPLAPPSDWMTGRSPTDHMSGGSWRCECGSTGACGHVMLRNQISCVAAA